VCGCIGGSQPLAACGCLLCCVLSGGQGLHSVTFLHRDDSTQGCPLQWLPTHGLHQHQLPARRAPTLAAAAAPAAALAAAHRWVDSSRSRNAAAGHGSCACAALDEARSSVVDQEADSSSSSSSSGGGYRGSCCAVTAPRNSRSNRELDLRQADVIWTPGQGWTAVHATTWLVPE